MHNPSEIDQNQLLLVRFPKLGSNDVIVPGMANLSFNIKLSLTADLKRVLVSNVGFKGIRYWVWTASKFLHATKTCGRQSQKGGMQ